MDVSRRFFDLVSFEVDSFGGITRLHCGFGNEGELMEEEIVIRMINADEVKDFESVVKLVLEFMKLNSSYSRDLYFSAFQYIFASAFKTKENGYDLYIKAMESMTDFYKILFDNLEEDYERE